MFLVGSHLAEAVHHGGDGFIEGGGAGGDADIGDAGEPLFAEVVGRFDLMGTAAETGGFFGELAGVVAIAPADDDHHGAALANFLQSGLALFGGMADGVDEAHLGAWMLALDSGDQLQHTVKRLRGLGDHAEPRRGWNLKNIDLIEHDTGFWEIADQATHLDMLPLADDDGVVTLCHECGECLMRLLHERAGRVRDRVARFLPSLPLHIRRSMGGNDDALGAGGVMSFELATADAERLQMGIDDGVVDELSEDGDGFAHGGVMRGAESVTHAEAHAVVLG